MSFALVEDGAFVAAEKLAAPIRTKLREAREHRKRFEPGWQSNLAFAAGEHWYVWDRSMRTLRKIQEVDPRYRGRELYSSDIITEYRLHVLGELGSDDDRPELLIEHDEQAAEDFQKTLNNAVGYGWENEAHVDQALAEADRLCIDLGVSAVQCNFDPQAGRVRQGDTPILNGKPILDMGQASEVFANGPNPDVQMQQIHEGCLRVRPLSAFNLLVPPGVTHERDFPWEAITFPVPVETLRDEYGAALGPDFREDADITSTLGTASESGAASAASYGIGEARATRLRGHAWLTFFFERPTGRYPNGRVFHMVGNAFKCVRMEQKLPYQGPDGTYRSGISYFHWWRVSGRFWSRGLMDVMKDPQRAHNKRRMQVGEMIDRGLPYVLAARGANEQIGKKTQQPMEVVVYDPGAGPPPHPVQGMGPGPWMGAETEQIRQDLEHATGVRGPSIGENPSQVSTYGQLALLKEADTTKREVILRERSLAIGHLIENLVWDIRTYWGAEKTIMLAGEEDKVQAEVFNATKVPAFFIVKIAKGSAKPRSEAAELKKVEDIWQAALASGAVAPRAAEWIAWFKESLDAGQVRDLPSDPADEQLDKAVRENHFLTTGEREIAVAEYDPPEVHIPIHRTAQIQAEQSEDLAAWQRVAAHISEHMEVQQLHDMQMRAQQGLPPQGGPPPGQASPPGGDTGGGAAPSPGGSSMPALPAGAPGGGQSVNPTIDISLPITIAVPEAQVEVQSQAPQLPPNVHVEVQPPTVQGKTVTFERDGTGRIVTAHVEDEQGGGGVSG